MGKFGKWLIIFVGFMIISLVGGRVLSNYFFDSQYKGFNGYWEPTDVLAEGSQFKIENKRMYEMTSDGKEIKYNLRKDGVDYLVNKDDIPASSFMYDITTPKIENPSPNGETDVIYITGNDGEYSYKLPLYKVSKNESKFKGSILSLRNILIGLAGLSIGSKYFFNKRERTWPS